MDSRRQGAYPWRATSLDELRSESWGLSEQDVMCRSGDEKGPKREMPGAVCRGGADGRQCPPGTCSAPVLGLDTFSTTCKFAGLSGISYEGPYQLSAAYS